MKQFDVIYRALTDYEQQTIDDRYCKQMRKAIAAASPEADIISSVRTLCTIEEDWIIAIEEGLKFIEKAIDEARQHILVNGEVVPIEKAKRVSKDSIKHLAKHSDMITRQSSSDILIPDKLYIVERLSDFAVYENKFLYMLLVYLKDFISSKYSKILELSNTYHGSVTMNKSVAMSKRKLTFELKMTDELHDDPYLRDNNPGQAMLERIENLLKTVIHLLATPLLQEVAKAPILKPPITKTNVLKMNQNFKGAVVLYDFVTSYDKQGFVSVKREELISPFPLDIAEEFAGIPLLTSFLTYKNSLGLNSLFKSALDKEDIRRKEIEAAKQEEQLEQLRNRIAQSSCSPMEYMLLLEKRNKSLELDSMQLDAARQQIESLQSKVVALEQDVQQLSAAAMDKQTEILSLNSKFAEETASLISNQKVEIDKLNEQHSVEIDKLNELKTIEINELSERYTSEINELNAWHLSDSDTLKSEHEQAIAELEGTRLSERTARDSIIAELEQRIREEIGALKEANAKIALDHDIIIEAKTLSDARVNALRKEYKLITNDDEFTSKASFNELEHQYKVFKAFYREEWKKAKKHIRKELLSPKPQDRANSGSIESTDDLDKINSTDKIV